MEHHLSGCNKIATFRKPGLLKEEKKNTVRKLEWKHK